LMPKREKRSSRISGDLHGCFICIWFHCIWYSCVRLCYLILCLCSTLCARWILSMLCTLLSLQAYLSLRMELVWFASVWFHCIWYSCARLCYLRLCLCSTLCVRWRLSMLCTLLSYLVVLASIFVS
jgi:hypothetical protein